MKQIVYNESNEEWKKYKNTGYEISNIGRVRSVDRYINVGDNSYTRFHKGKILNQSVRESGYVTIGLRIDKKRKIFYVHRLVAETFIPNPNGFPQVNHKNCNKKDNTVSNLEWVTVSENIKHAFLTIGRKGKEIQGYKSIREMSRRTGVPFSTLQRRLEVKQNEAQILF